MDDVLERFLELFPGEVGVESEEGAEGAEEVFCVSSTAFDGGEVDGDLTFEFGLIEGVDVPSNDERGRDGEEDAADGCCDDQW